MIYEYILRHPGCSIEAIVGYVYAERPDGGPDDAAASVRTIISYLRRNLVRYGLTVKNGQGAGIGSSYSIAPIEKKPSAKAALQLEGSIHGST